jgi:hypothetical protein
MAVSCTFSALPGGHPPAESTYLPIVGGPMPIRCLIPPSSSPLAVTDPVLPLGGAFVCDLQDGLPDLAEALVCHRQAPWCPVVVRITNPRVTARVLAAFEPRPGMFAVLYPCDFANRSPLERARSAVWRRPDPSGRLVAGYVAERLELPVAALLEECCDTERRHGHAPRTLTRRVRALGPFEVRDWRGLGRLARMVTQSRLEPGISLERAGWAAGVDPRSARRWLRLFTGFGWAQAVGRFGWEWIVESALRRGGYLRAGNERRMAG